MFATDLRGASLVGARLVRSDLRGACLRGARLVGASMIDADLRKSNMAESGDSEQELNWVGFETTVPEMQHTRQSVVSDTREKGHVQYGGGDINKKSKTT